MDIVFFLSLVLAVPALLYFVGNHGNREAWGLVLRGFQQRGAGAYRSVPVPIWRQASVPLTIRAAAITSFILGQMVVPGAFAAFVGLIASVATLTNEAGVEWSVIVITCSAPSGLYIAGSLLSVGLALLRRADDAAVRSRKVGWISIVHNVVLLGLLALLVLFGATRAHVITFPVVYGFVSIAHAALLLAAARALEARGVQEERDREAAGAPDGIAVSTGS